MLRFNTERLQEPSDDQRDLAAAAPAAGLAERKVDLKEMASILKRRRWTLIASVAGFLALGILFLLIVTPKYTATATILIDPRKENVLENQAVLSSFGSDDAAVESQ